MREVESGGRKGNIAFSALFKPLDNQSLAVCPPKGARALGLCDCSVSFHTTISWVVDQIWAVTGLLNKASTPTSLRSQHYQFRVAMLVAFRSSSSNSPAFHSLFTSSTGFQAEQIHASHPDLMIYSGSQRKVGRMAASISAQKYSFDIIWVLRLTTPLEYNRPMDVDNRTHTDWTPKPEMKQNGITVLSQTIVCRAHTTG